MTTTKKVIKKTRKLNPKDLAKAKVMEILIATLEGEGVEYTDGVEYGMTKGTIVVHIDGYDVQIKPISPKAGLDRYQTVEYEGEDEEIAE